MSRRTAKPSARWPIIPSPGRIGQLRQEAARLEVTTKVDGEKTTVTVAVQSLVPTIFQPRIPVGPASCWIWT